jgi:hypothetical protein
MYSLCRPQKAKKAELCVVVVHVQAMNHFSPKGKVMFVLVPALMAGRLAFIARRTSRGGGCSSSGSRIGIGMEHYCFGPQRVERYRHRHTTSHMSYVPQQQFVRCVPAPRRAR